MINLPKPVWYYSLPTDLIDAAAAEKRINPLLVAAIVRKESAGRSFACRFEGKDKDPKVGYQFESHVEKYLVTPGKFAKALGQSLNTEIIQQMCSWGLMQVMGFKARENKYDSYLPMLCLPHIGLEQGCLILWQELEKHEGHIPDAVASYNAGSPRFEADGKTYRNQAYVTDVLNSFKELGGIL